MLALLLFFLMKFVDYEGSTIALLLAFPNWESPITVELSLPTDVTKARSGLESRRPFAASARYTLGYRALFADAAETTAFRLWLMQLQDKTVAVPMWPDQVELAAAINAGATAITKTDFNPVRSGAPWLIINKAGTTFEIVTVDSLVGNDITLHAGTVNAWPKGTFMFPLLFGHLQERPKAEALTDEVTQCDLKIKESSSFARRLNPFGGAIPVCGAGVPDFSALPLFNIEPNFARAVDLTEDDIDWKVVGFGREERATTPATNLVRRGLEFEFFQTDRSAIAAIERFFVDRRGSVRKFMLPSFRGDLRASADLPLGPPSPITGMLVTGADGDSADVNLAFELAEDPFNDHAQYLLPGNMDPALGSIIYHAGFDGWRIYGPGGDVRYQKHQNVAQPDLVTLPWDSVNADAPITVTPLTQAFLNSTVVVNGTGNVDVDGMTFVRSGANENRFYYNLEGFGNNLEKGSIRWHTGFFIITDPDGVEIATIESALPFAWDAEWTGGVSLTRVETDDNKEIPIEASEYLNPERETNPADAYIALIKSGVVEPHKLASVEIDGLHCVTSIDDTFLRGSSKLSHLHLSRFVEPKIAWSYLTDGKATAKIKFIELPNEYLGVHVDLPESVYLYRFIEKLAVPQYTRVTSYENTFTVDAETFLPGPFDHGGIKNSRQFDQDNFQIRTFRTPDNPLRRFLPFSFEAPLYLEVLEADAADPGNPPTVLWKGRVSELDVSGDDWKGICKVFGGIFERPFPNFNVQKVCNYSVYSPVPKCGVNKETFRTSGNILVIDGTEVRIAAGSAKPANYFGIGFIETGAGANYERRSVMSSEPLVGVGTKLILNAPLLKAIEGQSLSAFPGCNGAVETCIAVFNNLSRFGGHAYVSNDNPSVKAMEPKTSSGGKK